MVVRQADQGRGVLRLDREDLEAVVDDGFLNECLEADVEEISTTAQLDGNFPITRRADELGVVGVFVVARATPFDLGSPR